MEPEPGVRPAVARIMDRANQVVGAAFLVDAHRLVTAAHVINLAFGRHKATIEQPPSGEVFVNFPAAPENYLRAELLHWRPPGGAAPEDVAVLRLMDPPPAAIAPARLAYLPDPADRAVTTFGFPVDAPNGGWARGRLAGADARGYVQLDSRPDSQFDTEAGFSGTPVWDVEAGAVVGMVLEGWRSARRSGFMIPTAGLVTAWPALGDLLRPASPFRGLTAFREQDTGVFHGRAELVDRVVRRASTDRVITLFGSSGVGKSSVLHAGVLPRLRRTPGLAVALTRPGEARTPLRSLALAMARAADPHDDPLLRGARIDEITTRLAAGETAEVVAGVLESRSAERLVLVVDQLEELFTAADDEITRFAAALVPGPRLTVLSGLRADFIGRLLQRPDLAELARDTGLVTVGEMSPAELREAITCPVADSGVVAYQDGLVERLITDVGVKFAPLPLLQFVLSQLWEQQSAGLLTHEAYERLGGINEALANHAEAIWRQLTGDERAAAQRLLAQLLYPLPDGSGFVRRAAPRDQLREPQWAAAQRLSDGSARLVVIRARDTGPAVAELAHDSLIRHWDRLGRLSVTEAEFREWQEGLRQRVRQWEDRGRGRDRLLRGEELHEAATWQDSHPDEFGAAELTYLAASREAGRQRFWSRLRLRTTLTVVAVVAAVVAGVAVYAVRQAQVAGAAATNLVSTMTTLDRYSGLRQTLRAFRTSDNADSKRWLGIIYGEYAPVDRLLPDNTGILPHLPDRKAASIPLPGVLAGQIAADGRTFATTGLDDGLVAWHVDGTQVIGQPLHQLARRVAISRDGRYIASAQPALIPYTGPTSGCPGRSDHDVLDDCVMLYDTVTKSSRLLGWPDGDGEPTVAFDPTGQVVAAGFFQEPGTVRFLLWDRTTGRQLADVSLPGHMLDLRGMWLGPGGHRITFVDEERATDPTIGIDVLRSVDIGDGQPVFHLLEQSEVDAGSAAGSLSGNRMAVIVPGAADRPARLDVWDLATGNEVASIDGLSKDQSSGGVAALDADGSHVFVQAVGHTVSAWTVTGGTRAARTWPIGSTWQDLVPLGVGLDAPIAVVDQNAVGLVLPAPGRPAALSRLSAAPADTSDNTKASQWADALTSMLVDDVERPGALDNLPAGTYTGPLRR